MLSHEGTKKGYKAMTVEMWEDEEFDLIAAELKRLFPKKSYQNYHGLEFLPEQVEEAAETVLPQHRHKSVTDYHDIRRPMFNAFTRLAQPQADRPKLSIVPGNTLSNGGIRWSPQEWEAVILELNRVCPTAFEERLKNVQMPAVRIAMEVLDIPRRRHFKQIVGFKEQALKMWDDMPEEMKNPAKAERIMIDFETGPVMAPAVSGALKDSTMAAALQKAFVNAQEENEKKARKSPVHWTADEWLIVAREMHRQNPHANYLISGFFSIDLPAIRDAQRVLPLERRRRLMGTVGLQKPLVDAFKMLAEEMAQQENARIEAEKPAAVQIEQPAKKKMSKAESMALARAKLKLKSKEERSESALKARATRLARAGKSQPVQVEVPAKPVAKAAEEVPPMVTQKAEFVPLNGHEMSFYGKILNAAMPLMNVLIDEAVTRLTPNIVSGLMPQLEKSLGGMIERAIAAQIPKTVIPAPVSAPVPVTVQAPEIAQEPTPAPIAEVVEQVAVKPEPVPGPLSKAELAKYLPQPTEKAKKPKIALLMPPGSQREQVRSAFREFDFIFIDHGQGIKEAGASCALFIANEAYVNTANRQNIKANVPPEKLKYVDGGLTAIKRQIRIWKASTGAVYA